MTDDCLGERNALKQVFNNLYSPNTWQTTRNSDEYRLTIKKKMNHEIAYTKQAYKKHTLSNRALLHQFLKLGKFI